MNYKVWGDKSKPALVLIHGYGSSQETFAATAARLSRDFYVITYDKRAHGGTVARR